MEVTSPVWPAHPALHPGEDYVSAWGYRLLQGKRARDAVNVFARNVVQHMGSANPYDSLAEGRDAPGDRKRAFPNCPKRQWAGSWRFARVWRGRERCVPMAAFFRPGNFMISRFAVAIVAMSILLAACSHPATPPSSVATASPAAPVPAPTPAPTPPPYVLDDTEVRDVPSKILGRDYQLYVSLPANYASEPDRRYPVVFVTDAPYAFPLIRSIARRVGDHGKGLRDFILVGLSYAKGDTPVYSRNRDYTPTPKGPDGAVSDMPGRAPVYGEAEGYRRFIAEEVFPFVASHYRADMSEKIYAGHSYGGLFGVHVLLTDPDMFQHYILGSPSLQFGDRTMFERERAYAASHKDLKADVFMAIGGFETIDSASPDRRYHNTVDMVRNALAFEKALASRHYPGLRVRSVVIGDEDHLTVFPSIITRGLQAMLSPSR